MANDMYVFSDTQIPNIGTYASLSLKHTPTCKNFLVRLHIYLPYRHQNVVYDMIIVNQQQLHTFPQCNAAFLFIDAGVFVFNVMFFADTECRPNVSKKRLEQKSCYSYVYFRHICKNDVSFVSYRSLSFFVICGERWRKLYYKRCCMCCTKQGHTVQNYFTWLSSSSAKSALET